MRLYNCKRNLDIGREIMTTVFIDHITLDDNAVARVGGSRSKVTQIVCDVRNGMSPEMIREEVQLTFCKFSATVATILLPAVPSRNEP